MNISFSPNLHTSPCGVCDHLPRLLHEVISSVWRQAASGFIVAYFYPAMVWPCLTFTAVVILTHLAANTHCCYNSSLLVKGREAVGEINIQYPNLHTITQLFALALSLLSVKLAVALAGIVGIYNGVLIGIEASRRAQLSVATRS